MDYLTSEFILIFVEELIIPTENIMYMIIRTFIDLLKF